MAETIVIGDEFENVEIECGDYLKFSNPNNQEGSWHRVVHGRDSYALVSVENGYYMDSVDRSRTFELSVRQFIDETEHLDYSNVEAVAKSEDAEVRLSDPKVL